MRLQHISLLHNYSPCSSTCNGPLHVSLVCPVVGSFPWCPSRAPSPPAGALRPHDESLLWIRSASTNPSADGVVALLWMLFGEAVARACVSVCVCVYYIWMWVSVDPEGWKPVTEGIPPVTLTVIVRVCLNRAVRSSRGAFHPWGTDSLDLWPCTVLVVLGALSQAHTYQRGP